MCYAQLQGWLERSRCKGGTSQGRGPKGINLLLREVAVALMACRMRGVPRRPALLRRVARTRVGLLLLCDGFWLVGRSSLSKLIASHTVK